MGCPRAAAALCRGCGTPASGRRLGWAWEDQWRSRKLAKGSVWGEEGRRRRLGGGLGGGGGHGVVAPLRVQGEAVVRPGRFTGRGGCYLGVGLWRRRGRAEVSRRARGKAALMAAVAALLSRGGVLGLWKRRNGEEEHGLASTTA